MNSTLFFVLCLVFLYEVQAVTVILDFNDPDQESTFRWGAETEEVSTFNVSAFGFEDTEAGRTTFTTAILDAVLEDYHFDLGIATGDSSLNGKQLDINFEIGDHGSAPTNGDAEYYFFQIGTATSESALGRAIYSAIRRKGGAQGTGPEGEIIGSVFANNIDDLYQGRGDWEAVNLVTGTLSHEIGHALSLRHIDYNADWVSPNGKKPLMASGATGLPSGARRFDREFLLSGFQEDGTEVNEINRLMRVLGVRDIIPEPSGILLAGLGLGCLVLNRKKALN